MKFARSMHALTLGLLAGFSVQVAAQTANPPARADEPRRTVAQTADDAALTAKVKSALVGDNLVKARNIDVDTKWGVVSLVGRVASEAERDQALQLARRVEGVRSVRANLSVVGERLAGQRAVTPSGRGEADRRLDADRRGDADRPATRAERTGSTVLSRVDKAGKKAGSKLDDVAITTKVKATMIRDDLVKARNIDVDTKDGRVTLTGNVASNAERDQAVRLARKIEGVKSVQANLKIGPATASSGASAKGASKAEHAKPVSE